MDLHILLFYCCFLNVFMLQDGYRTFYKVNRLSKVNKCRSPPNHQMARRLP